MKFEKWFKENKDDLDGELWEKIEDVDSCLDIEHIKHLLRNAFWSGFAANANSAESEVC